MVQKSHSCWMWALAWAQASSPCSAVVVVAAEPCSPAPVALGKAWFAEGTWQAFEALGPCSPVEAWPASSFAVPDASSALILVSASCCPWHSLVSVAASEKVYALWRWKRSNELANLAAVAMVNCNIDLGPSVMSASSHAHKTGLSHSAMVAGNWCNTEPYASATVCILCISKALDLMSPLLMQSCVEIGRPSNGVLQEHVGCVCAWPVQEIGFPSDAKTRLSWRQLFASAIVGDELQSPSEVRVHRGSALSETSKITKTKRSKKTM